MTMDRTTRKRILGLITFLIVVPLLVLFWDLTIGIYLLFGGLLIASFASSLLARDARKQMFSNPEENYASSDRAGDVIWVSLDDEHGNPLPESEAKQKMNQARANAGPMDQVRVKPSKK